LPQGLSSHELERVEALIIVRRKVKRGEPLVRHGEKFTSLQAIRTGFFKTRVALPDGREQVTGFQMAGDIIGLDGIAQGQHTGDVMALEDAEVGIMPFDRLETLAREITALQRHLYKLMSQEIVRERRVMLLLGSMRSDERVAQPCCWT
jgi:CRP/FNR family transcriptional regulator